MRNGITLASLFTAICLFTACSETGERIENADSVSEMATQDTAVLYDRDRAWTAESFEQEPVIEEPELKDAGVEVRGTETRTVYALDQDILFETDKAQLRKEADEKLKKVATVIRKRMEQNEADVFIYGHTDSRAGNEYNKELGRDRAQSVADWLTTNGEFDPGKLTVKTMGELAPVATNETPEGRQQNRRVEIVVIRK